MKCVRMQYIYPVLLLVKLQMYFSDILFISNVLCQSVRLSDWLA